MSAKDDLFVPGENDRQVSRREALWRGVLGSAGLLAANHFSRQQSKAAEAPSPSAEPAAASASSGPPPAKAKAVIQIWMWGGPPHTDTFDPKPGRGQRLHGPADPGRSSRTSQESALGLVAGTCQGGRQVLDHPVDDSRGVRARNSFLHGPNGSHAGRPVGISVGWCGGHRLQGLPGGIGKPDSSLYRP